jgi:hypothetical protein
VARVGIGTLGERRLEAGEHHLDRVRRLRVGGRLQADRVRTGDERAVLLGLVVELAGAARVVEVALREPGGLAAERAIGIELDALDGEPLVAERAVQAQLERRVEQVREQVARDAHGEAAGLGEPQVRVELALGDLRIADRGDAAGEELRLRALELPHELGRLVAEVEVGAMVADLHAVEPREHVARGVGQLAGELAVGIAEELASLRVGCVAGDAVPLERP